MTERARSPVSCSLSIGRPAEIYREVGDYVGRISEASSDAGGGPVSDYAFG